MNRPLLPWLLATLASLLALTASLAFASPASAAQSKVRFAIADQHPVMFTDPRWQALGLRKTRYNVPWNAATDPFERERAVTYVKAANAAGVQTLVHLTGRVGEDGREPLPSRRAYRTAMRKLVALLRPLGVRNWGVWNEANHSSQPTFKRADRAAEYFLEMRAACKGCTIVALDVLTQGKPSSKGVASYRGYTRRFMAALGSKRSLVKVIGIHNYGELTDGKGAYKSRDLMRFSRRYAKRARFWMTESGGLAASRTRSCSESRQTTGTRRMFSHARALHKDGLDRLYAYNWTAADCEDRFDSGLIRTDGTARPAFRIVERETPRMRN